VWNLPKTLPKTLGRATQRFSFYEEILQLGEFFLRFFKFKTLKYCD
jgi:hypothetical protein